LQVDNSGLQLTYCTNIHAANGWDAVWRNLKHFAPALKARFAPGRPFGLGLRLSAREARELLDGRLVEFRRWLDDSGLYVALINGFPYGNFHGEPVKESVYAPDWRQEERVAYTLDLVEILNALLPDGMEGGISTAPISYKGWGGGTSAGAARTSACATTIRNLVRVGRAMEGTRIHLDIEPEPDCVLENSEETIEFFGQWGAELGEHVQLCFDCCHFAVEYEDSLEAIRRLRSAGIPIGRVQLSSAVQAVLPRDSDRLRAFADSTYLHQVVTRDLRHFPDLPQALDANATGECRVHFHVPLFTREYDGLSSTQDYVRAVIQETVRAPFTRHLEIETYTWDVLPGELKIDLLDSIGREYEWVLSCITSHA
jgi:sugar phosphate isomerase/epimerase